MKSAIIQKINAIILNGISTEAEVYYIIGQSRKFLEEEFPSDRTRETEYPTLTLFEDWVLHSKLTRSRAQKKLEEYAKHLLKEDGERDPFKLMTNISMFSDLMVDLNKFCSNYNVSETLLLKKTWKKFLFLLIEILKDIPLINDKGCYINKFVIKDNDISDCVTFEVYCTDGVRGTYQIDFKIIAELPPQ
jgi:hypothetical protein